MPLAGMLGLPSLAEAAQAAASSYRRPKLKITEIRTAEVRVHGYQVHVRVYTDQGIIGQGESTDAAMGNVPLIRSFARLLVGQDPLNVEAAFERIRTSGVFAGAQAGQYVTALTGVEIALWDIAGKALGLPVYQLLGGKVRDRVRVYCDSGSREMIPGDERSLARIHEIQELGFHRRQDRYRRRRGPGAVRPRQLDRLQRRDRAHGRQDRVHAGALSQEHRSCGGHACPL